LSFFLLDQTIPSFRILAIKVYLNKISQLRPGVLKVKGVRSSTIMARMVIVLLYWSVQSLDLPPEALLGCQGAGSANTAHEEHGDESQAAGRLI
jgi:hypothetical protein